MLRQETPGQASVLQEAKGKLQLRKTFSAVAVPLLLFGAGCLKGQGRQSIRKSTNTMAKHLFSTISLPTPMFWGVFSSRLLQALFSSQLFIGTPVFSG